MKSTVGGGSRTRRREHAIRIPDRGYAYFFDIDGTLLEIASSPGAVRVDPALRGLIRQLQRSTQGAVALISGRSIAEIDALFPGMELPVAGQHGVERRDARGRITRHRFPVHRLDAVRRQLVEVVNRHAGLLLEDKGLSVALHYRKAPRLAGYANRLARSFQAALGAEYCVQKGKRVVEIKPSGADKGSAIQEFMREAPFKGRAPVFVGDDATDEYGFATVNRLHGRSVKVGPGATAALTRLPHVSAVRTWLESEIQA